MSRKMFWNDFENNVGKNERGKCWENVENLRIVRLDKTEIDWV